MDFPFLVFVLSLGVLCLAAGAGDILRSKVHPLVEEERDDFDALSQSLRAQCSDENIR
jgi:hypothetical protein